ncbi:MAG: hypothetical protein ACLPSW_08305 [Roseiarcus sp.]
MDEDKPSIITIIIVTPEKEADLASAARLGDQKAKACYGEIAAFHNDIRLRRGEPLACICCDVEFGEQAPALILIAFDEAEEIPSVTSAGVCATCSKQTNEWIFSKFEASIRALGEDWQRLDPGNMPDDSGNA